MSRADLDTAVILAAPLNVEAELDRLADRYVASRRSGLQVLNRMGLRTETLLNRLPEGSRAALLRASEQALWAASRAAQHSHRVPPQANWAETGVAMGLGALGGVGGIATTTLEIPASTALLLRRIQQVAAGHGFDIQSESVAFDSLRVFGDSGPLTEDDGADTGFLATRMALSGESILRMVQVIAPRLAAAMGKKLAAQMVPVLGGAAGAGLNLLYRQHYDAVADVQFGLRRLAVDADLPRAELEDAFANRVAAAR